MTPRRKKGKGRAKRRSGRARGWITALLVILLGVFGYSIYLGATAARPSGGVPHEAASLELPPPPPAVVPDSDSPTLVVWNGCGRPGLGGRVSGWLRRQGFDVFETTNADRMDYDETVVIQRSGRAEAAEAIASKLRGRLGVGRVVVDPVRAPQADVLLILGRDFPDSLPVY